jgi:hypothetical protein
MQKIHHALIILLITFSSGFASHVYIEDARTVALRFISEHSDTDSQNPGISGTFTRSEGAVILYYIFNIDPQGWIIIAADDAIHPVLAYSFEGKYDPGKVAPQFTAWMKQYEDQIFHAHTVMLPPLPSTANLWDKYTNPAFSILHPVIRNGVSPMITSRWDQAPYYNEMCPADPAGPGGHCVAGCVPVAMAQIMFYYRWPETGTGSYSYTDPVYGIQSADFGATPYYWNEMANSVTKSSQAVAGLIYHLGVSCDLQYGPSGSGMYNHKAAYSLRTFFKYSPETQYVFRDSTTMNWDSILIAHLEREMPMYYAGWSEPNVMGHAFVCDGYQDSSYFHFNFGWGGSSDGYFYTSDLIVGGSNFNLAQEVIINCYPDTTNYTFPLYCTGNQDITTFQGSLEDGSSPVKDCLPGASCSWLIDPQTATDSVSNIIITFSRFETNTGDLVTVYDGETTLFPLLGSFSGSSLPPVITTNGNKCLITFQSHPGSSSAGWMASYTTTSPTWCGGLTNISADTAEITDGSYGFDYSNNMICKWRIQPVNEDTLTVYFRSFDTEPGKDFLVFYDLSTQDTLAALSGHYEAGALPDPVVCPSGKLFVVFSTNNSITASGWEFYYPKSTIGIETPDGSRQIQVYPNPAQDILHILVENGRSETYDIRFIDMTGKEMLTARIQISEDITRNQIDIRKLNPGLYLVKITGEEGTFSKKLMIL